MNDLITIKGGNGKVPVLQNREPGYSYDEEALYIGTDKGNKRLCGANDIGSILTEISSINTKINSTNSEISSINTKINSTNSEISRINTKINSTNSEISRINGLIEGIQARLDELEKQNK